MIEQIWISNSEWKFHLLSYKPSQSIFFFWSLCAENIMILFLWPFEILISNTLRHWFPHFQKRYHRSFNFLSFCLYVICSCFPTSPNTTKWQKMSCLGKLKWSLSACFQGTVCILNIHLIFFQIIFALYNINLKANWKYIWKAIYSFIIMLTENFWQKKCISIAY